MRITVDYGRMLSERIAAGGYDWIGRGIEESLFPIEGEGIIEFEVHLVHPNEHVFSEEAVERISMLDPQKNISSRKI